MNAGAMYVGLISGTSVDSIDAALVSFDSGRPTLRATHSHPIDGELKAQILELCQPGPNEIDRMGELDRALGASFAEATHVLLSESGHSVSEVAAIGSHGQTIRHRPPGTVSQPFTTQIGDPNTIAHLTGITTVADFRRRDVAAGGHGAPLAPAFHAAVFDSKECDRFVVNIGGMANVTHLPVEGPATGFDTGPGNVLLDSWTVRHRGEPFDSNGDWAAQGNCVDALLAKLHGHPFLALDPPKSTGREEFNVAWLDSVLDQTSDLDPVDVQATLAEFTAQSISNCLSGFASEGSSEVFVCGGGAFNGHLMSRLQTCLSPHSVRTTGALGVPPEWVEAMAFAWLAHRTLERTSGNLPSVTGATREVILGGVYYA